MNSKFYTMSNEKKISTTIITCNQKCKHRNGWFKSVVFK